MRSIIQSLLMLLIAAVVSAQEKPQAVAPPVVNPVTEHNTMLWTSTNKILLRTAETMPEEYYSFKPSEDVRTFGQIIGHVADVQYYMCSAVLGEKNPSPKIEKTKTSKADLIAALNGAISNCQRAYDGLTDASGAALVQFSGRETPKVGVLTVNMLHTIEHYGNLVTYMRMKGIVPPTTDPEFRKELMKR